MVPSPFGRHGKILGNIVTALNNAIKQAKGQQANCTATVLVEVDWIISQDTVLRPDLVVVCGTEPERHLEAAPAVVVEVLSLGTRDRDLPWKREIYQ
jgi:Uma2 family endonuclease